MSRQTAPRPLGNWFTFTPQLAQNTLLTSRLPGGWSVYQNRPFLMGFGIPFTANAAENARRFTHAGYTHAERDVFVAQANVPVARRYRMMRDAEAMDQAVVWANTLPGSDPRKQHLLNYGQDKQGRITSQDWTMWRELGKRTYLASRGDGLAMVGFDIETFAPGTTTDDAHEFQVAANLGAGDGITERGDNTKIFQYGGTLADIVSVTKNRNDNDIYMRIPGPDWRGAGNVFDINASPLTTYYRTKGAYVGRDQYARRTWDERSYWVKNTDGSIRIDGNGNPVMVKMNFPTDRLTNYGVQSVVFTYEPLYHLQMWYEEADKILTDWRWLCNTPIPYDGLQNPGSMPYPKGTVDIRPGLEQLHTCAWYRDDTEYEAMYNPDLNGGNGEFEQHPTANNRPIYHRTIRYQMLMRCVLYHGNITWSDKAYANFEQGKVKITNEGGQNVTKPNLAMGQYEQMLAGNFQAKNFPKLFELMDARKIEFIVPNRFIHKGNRAVGHREVDKPIIWGLKEQAGRRVWLIWCDPTQDVNNASHEEDITAWVVLDNGQQTGSYKLRCKDRNTGFDGFLLPAGFENAQPRHWRFQKRSVLKQTFTWTGDYNVPWSGGNPVPPAPVIRQVLPASGGAQ